MCLTNCNSRVLNTVNHEGILPALRDFLTFGENRIKQSDDPGVTATTLMPPVDKLDPWLLGNFERAVSVSRQYATRVLGKWMFKDKDPAEIQRVTDMLNEGYFSHGFVNDRNEAREELGLNIVDIEESQWNEVWALYTLYRDLRLEMEYRGPIIETVESIEDILIRKGFSGIMNDDSEEMYEDIDELSMLG